MSPVASWPLRWHLLDEYAALTERDQRGLTTAGAGTMNAAGPEGEGGCLRRTLGRTSTSRSVSAPTRPLILFQWTGYAPRSMRHERPADKAHLFQVSCAAVFPSKAAFKRATNRRDSDMPWVSTVKVLGDESFGNEGARLALANQGVVFWQDSLRHAPGADVWLEHDSPGAS